MDRSLHRACVAIVLAGCVSACSQETNGRPESGQNHKAPAPQGTTADTESRPTIAALKREEITLRGIRFDEGDTREELQALCRSDAMAGGFTESRTKSLGRCELYRNRLLMPSFQYGNIATYANVLFSDEGWLLRFQAAGTTEEMLRLAAALAEKYGPPQISETEVGNRLGAKFAKKTFVWVDARGTMITVESVHDRLDYGRVVIESRSHQTATKVRERIRKEVDKAKL